MPKKSFFSLCLAVVLTLLFVPHQAEARSTIACFAIGTIEVLLPGTGYAVMGEWDKALSFGGTRWYTRVLANSQDSREVQTDSGQIYQTKDEKLHIFKNKETYRQEQYGGIEFKLGMVSIWDMYAHKCTPNNNAYHLMLAPLRFDHFYNKWEFWLPIGLHLLIAAQPGSGVKYTLGNGLRKSEALNLGIADSYVTGVGEEALFRGTIQHAFYNFYQSQFSASTSRYLGIFSSSVLFGAAHNGTGTQATAFTSFMFGLYLGYVYQPGGNVYDLITASAIHSWWNALAVYYLLQDAEETDESVKNITLSIVDFDLTF